MLLSQPRQTQQVISADNPLAILVLCTGNSARSIMAEALLDFYGRGAIRAYSAGSQPVGRVNPRALAQIQRHLPGEPRPGSKKRHESQSWHAYTGPQAPHLDAVITVCGNAACEVCPDFSGKPIKVHWGLPDPAAVEGDDQAKDAAFARCFEALAQRCQRLSQLLDEGTDKPGAIRWLQTAAQEPLLP